MKESFTPTPAVANISLQLPESDIIQFDGCVAIPQGSYLYATARMSNHQRNINELTFGKFLDSYVPFYGYRCAPRDAGIQLQR